MRDRTVDSLEATAKQIERHPVDLTMEVVVAELVENGIRLDDILIQPVGQFRRKYNRDLGRAAVMDSLAGKTNQLSIEVNRDGLYDVLPEGLFHQPTSRKPNKTTREVIAEFKLQKERERAARKFFLPFEQEFYRQRVFLSLEERRYLLDADQVSQSSALIEFWELPDILDSHQMSALLRLLPIAHRVVGNQALTRLCFESVLGDTVTIRLVASIKHSVPAAGIPGLGKLRLGTDFVLDHVYDDMIPATEVTVQVSSNERLPDYMPGGKNRQVLDFMFTYFIPFEADVVTVVKMADETQAFILSEAAHTGLLGYSCFL
jgi:hypothetical protein